jgi:serine/threonine protein kinase
MITSSFSQHFSGYDILGELGRGNARVLKARHQATGELVAIKHFSFNTDPETIRRFQRESEIMTAIQHPNIVKIKEVQLDALLPYIVMELVEGGDLRGLLKSSDQLDVPKTISLARQMAEAFKSIHSQGITHRDVKPENIMCRPQPNGGIDFLLTDFGIARLREQSHTVTGSAMMTYEYASPEQFDNPKGVTPATDYYSLGVVLYECLCGHVPFPLIDGRLGQFVNQVMHNSPPPLQPLSKVTVPPSLIRMINQLLAKNASERIDDPNQIDHWLSIAEAENAGREVTYQRSRSVTLPAPTPPRKNNETQAAPARNTPRPAQQYSPVVKSRGASATLIFFLCAGLVAAASASVYYFKVIRHRNDRQQSFEPKKTPVVPQENSQEAKAIYSPDSAALLEDFPADSIMTDDTYQPSEDTIATTPTTLPAPSTDIKEEPTSTKAFSDDFESNEKAWPLMDDVDGKITVNDSHIRVRGISDDYSYPSTKTFDIDTQKDFTASVNAKWFKGNTDDGFGMDYCSDDSNSSGYTFFITADGYYSIKYTKNNSDWIVLRDWTASPHINKKSGWNKLTVRREGNLIHFLINDRVTTAMSFDSAFGSNFGVRVAGAQTVDFDDFKVEGQKGKSR